MTGTGTESYAYGRSLGTSGQPSDEYVQFTRQNINVPPGTSDFYFPGEAAANGVFAGGLSGSFNLTSNGISLGDTVPPSQGWIAGKLSYQDAGGTIGGIILADGFGATAPDTNTSHGYMFAVMENSTGTSAGKDRLIVFDASSFWSTGTSSLTGDLYTLTPSPVVEVLPRTEWRKQYGGSAAERGYSVEQTSDGGFVTAGLTTDNPEGTSDFWLLRTDSQGNTLWTRQFGGTGYDECYSAQQTSDGGYVMAGFTNSFGAGWADVWLVKTDASGNQQWSRTFGGGLYDYGYSVQQTSDGGYIIGGQVNYGGMGNGGDAWLIKTDSSGNEVWNRTFSYSDNDIGHSVQQTSDGGYVLAGQSCWDYSLQSALLIKTDASGNELWSSTFGGSYSCGAGSVQQCLDGGFVMAGTTDFHGGSSQMWLIKTDSSGSLEWERPSDCPYGSLGHYARQASDGGYIVVGEAADGAMTITRDALVVRTDGEGTEIWRKTYGLPGDAGDPAGTFYGDGAFSTDLTNDGGYIVAGYTSSYEPDKFQDLWLIKIGYSAASQPTATSSGAAEFDTSAGLVENLSAVAVSSLPGEGKPSLNFPHGLFEFDVTGLTPGESVTVTITLPSAVPTNAQYWKYGPTPGDPTPHWYQIPMGDNDGDNVITITLIDGGLGDDDLTADGTIIDQGGPGWPPTPGGGRGVPVFPSVYAGIAAALGVGILAYLMRRRPAA